MNFDWAINNSKNISSKVLNIKPSFQYISIEHVSSLNPFSYVA